MSDVPPDSLYKDDTVYYLQHEDQLAFLGTVLKSDKIVPDLITLDATDSESMNDGINIKSGDIPTDIDRNHDAGKVSCDSVDRTGSSGAGNRRDAGPNIKISWMSLTTGDEYPPWSSPIPTSMKTSQVVLLERDHMLGDAVRHAQKDLVGTVVNLRISGCAELLNYGRILLNLDCSRLRSVSPWTSRTNENHVIWRGWLGRVVACQMLAIARFSDGARLLVRQACLENFEPVPPTSEAFPDPYFEGAWLRGDACDLKSNPEVSVWTSFTNFLLGTNPRVWSAAQTAGERHAKKSAFDQELDTDTPTLPVDEINHLDSLSKKTDCAVPGSPMVLFHELAQSDATKALAQNAVQMTRILERTPIFLTETRAHNAAWLSRLHSSVNVTVCIEKLFPAEATVHWFASRSPAGERPPPSIVRGEDLINLQTVVPYPYLGCTARDIWYLQLNESDVMYNWKIYDCPERLLYDWLTNNQAGLDAVTVPFQSVRAQPDVLSDAHKTGDTALAQSTFEAAGEPTVSHSAPQKPKEASDHPKTTPFWTQRTLFSSTRRRIRVIANPKRRLTYSNMVSWENEEHDLDVYLSDADSEVSTPADTSKGKRKVRAKRGATNTVPESQKAGEGKVFAETTFNTTSLEPPTMNSNSKKVQVKGTETTKVDPQPLTKLGQEEKEATGSGRSSPHMVFTDKPKTKVSEDVLRAREAQLPPLKPGCWVAVGLYTTHTRYDVRWQNGSLERDISCKDLLPIYFNIDEHEFFPGSVVSSKGAVKEPRSSSISSKNASGEPGTSGLPVDSSHFDEESPDDAPRDCGIVLSANPKDRMCRIQWFRTVGEAENKKLVPIGLPEDAGVYELTASADRQLNYGDVLLTQAADDPSHAHIPAGYIEDIYPETGKLLIHWIDGVKTEVPRTQCLLPVDALIDDDDWSGEDSDDYEPDELTTDSDSEWETISERSADEPNFSSTVEFPTKDDHNGKQLEDDAEVDGDLSQEEALRLAAEKVVQAYLRTDAARHLFVDRRTFVFWILRRFVVVPDQLDTAVDQLGTLLAAAASSPDYTLPRDYQSTMKSRQCSMASLSVVDESSVTTTGDNLRPPNRARSLVGELLSPAKAWDYAEEAEAVTVTEKLHSVRDLMQEAYQLVRDCRIKRLYAKCDHRELFSEKHVEGILKSIEIDGGTTLEFESYSSKSAPKPFDDTNAASDESAMQDIILDSESTVPRQISGLHFLHSDHHISRPEILAAVRRSKMKVLVVPDSSQPFTSSEDNWRNRIHYCLTGPNADEEGVYMLVSTTLFSRLSRYLAMGHRRLLEQLTSFGEYALAWLGEMAPDMVSKAKSESRGSIESEDLFHSLSGQTVIESTVVNSPETAETEVHLEQKTAEQDEKMENETEACEQSPGDDSSVGRPKLSRDDSQPGPTVDAIPAEYRGQFIVEDNAPTTHRFYRTVSDNLPKAFYRAWKRDNALLSTSLPRGIIVKSFSDRMDLYSLLIVGPAGTPYEHGLFFFDILLPQRYPYVPPQVHYYSFASERVNPNLYVEGHVCLSLLGTWAGKDSENWNPENSNLLQLVVSLQGLILNSEPYFNEAGFDACRGTTESRENSRVYNESVVVTLVQSMVSLLSNPVPVFKQETIQHCLTYGDAYASLLEFWASLDEFEYERLSSEDSNAKLTLPDFPLAPVSRGFQISVRRHRQAFLRLVAASTQNGT
ncbi:hypothetical protein CSKR_101668 [Clonorchis sinensis]|uniref:UBC core domain-containing protein n=1 Tax=Clonorchis sinensis TaxID=79923 RepID=A0A8T1M5D2_CLOSI|nr:hypothetical protein CSKR_101668 [Clonorchis sinensis]